MELTITVHVPRRRPRPVDVVVTWSGSHTAAELCAALADHLGVPVPALTSRGRAVATEALVGMPPLVHGAAVTVAGGRRPASVDVRPPDTILDLAVVGGPDSGWSQPLLPPGVPVGRAVPGGLVLGDPALSRLHATFRVGPAGIVVEDAGSTNGVLVDGRRIEGSCAVDGSCTVVVGSSTLRVRRVSGAGPPVRARGDGRLLVRPGGRPVAPAGPVVVECPPAPPERHRPRIPWLGALVPVPVAIGLAFVLGPQLLLLALVGPLAMLANAVGDRWGAGRVHRRETAAHAQAVDVAGQRLTRALREEVARLEEAYPDPHAVLRTAEHRLTTLWRGGDLAVRLGLGEVPTRVAWVDGTTTSHPVAGHAPVTVDLTQTACLGVVGSTDVTDRLLAALVGQLCARHPPSGLAVAVATEVAAWDWARRMPHATAPSSLTSGSGADGATARLLLVPREAGPGGGGLVPAALASGAVVVVAASHRSLLPPGCGAVLEPAKDGTYRLDGSEGSLALTLDLVGGWWSDRISRALAPLLEERAEDRPRLPQRVALSSLHPIGQATPERVVAAWGSGGEGARSGRCPPVALVGQGLHGPHRIDLRQDGPHLLVGGTTGSGKSEFLRTLVASLAIACPPADLGFVLVDFKGGASFGPCADLPHVLGLVTDLDEHLVDRALTSLRAELRRREQLLATVGATDLDDYRHRCAPGADPLPRLVVVIDELRALVDEVPGFVSGLVRLAALGRSLGIHLVLATQRPAGVVTAEIQANVNLRIAFRVRDRSDSVDVLADPAAAHLPPGTPGRALARGGDGSLVEWQAAVVAYPSDPEPGRRLSVRAPTEPSPRSLTSPSAAGDQGEGRPDAAAHDGSRAMADLVAVVAEAHRRTGARRVAPPWLPPLQAQVPLRPAGARLPARVGLVDEPDRQRVVPLTWTPGAGSWLLVGRPRTGRTTAARALVLAAASAHEVARLHVHVVDTAGSLADLAALPHVGTRVRSDDASSLTALVGHLRDVVEGRRARAQPGLEDAPPTVLVVIDGWEQLLDAHPDGGLSGIGDALVRVLRDGQGVGVVGVVTGGRALLQPRWSALGATVFFLGPADPLDAALAGLRSSELPGAPPPGRGVRTSDRREVQFVAATAELTAEVAAAVPALRADEGPFVLRPLPTVVRHRSGGSPWHAGRLALALGVAGPSASLWRWEPDRVGRRLLVLGPRRSGRSTALRVLAREATAAGRAVALVGGRSGTSWPRATLDPAPRPQEPGQTDLSDPTPSGTSRTGPILLGPDDLDELVDLRRRHPDLVLLVDDADLHDDAPLVPVMRQISERVDRDGGLVVVASSPTALLTRFRGIDVDVARHRTGLMLMPRPSDGDLLGAGRLDGIPSHPGRGVLVCHGEVTELQVLLAEEESDGVLLGGGVDGGGGVVGVVGAGGAGGVVRVPGGRGGQGREEAPHHHSPPHEGDPAAHQPEADGQEQQPPDDRGGSGPRVTPDPPTGDGRQRQRPDDDEHRRHDDPRGTAALAERELVDVEAGEPGQDGGLPAHEQGGEAAGAA